MQPAHQPWPAHCSPDKQSKGNRPACWLHLYPVDATQLSDTELILTQTDTLLPCHSRCSDGKNSGNPSTYTLTVLTTGPEIRCMLCTHYPTLVTTLCGGHAEPHGLMRHQARPTSSPLGCLPQHPDLGSTSPHLTPEKNLQEPSLFIRALLKAHSRVGDPLLCLLHH